MASTLAFYKGSNFSEYKAGAIYFDDELKTIKVGKGGTDFDEYSGVRSTSWNESTRELTIINSLGVETVISVASNIDLQDLRADVGKKSSGSVVATGIHADIENLQSLHVTGKTVAQEVKDGLDTLDVKKLTDSGDYASRYAVYKGTEQIGVTIDIPKDMVVKAAAVISYNGTDDKITIDGVEYTVKLPKPVAGKYVVMIIDNKAESQLWLNVQDLVDIYTGGETETVKVSIDENNIITASVKNNSIQWSHLHTNLQAKINGKVDSRLEGTNGTAIIFNESDGGGSRFENKTGVESFVGVNDMGADGTGLGIQLYVDKNIEGSWKGATIKGYNDKFYYQNYDNRVSGKPSSEFELAVKRDLPGVATTATPGLIKVGTGLLIDANGKLDVDATILSDIKVIAGTGISVTSSGNKYTVSTVVGGANLGAVKNGGNIEIDSEGNMNLLWS